MLQTIPVVGSLAYPDAVRVLPARFDARVVPEPDNRYNVYALSVTTEDGAKIGYVAPDVARNFYETVLARHKGGSVVRVPARRSEPGARIDVLVLVDLRGLASDPGGLESDVAGPAGA